MVYMYHSFLIHSSADGHLGCFHVLAIINSAASVVYLLIHLLLFICVLTTACSMQNLSSLTRGGTHTLCRESIVSKPLDY